jgi:hypothetical protein
MQFRFSWNCFVIEFPWSRPLRLLALCVCLEAAAQTLDWSGDVTVFGTAEDERAPVLVISPSGARLRALCVRNDSCLCMKASGDNGASWSASSDSIFPGFHLRARGTADASYHYILVCPEASSTRMLFRFEPASNSFRAAWTMAIAPERDGTVLSFDVMTDVAFQPADAYLNVCWVEQNAPHLRKLCFAQSRNRAVSFEPARELVSFEAGDGTDASVSLGAAWQGDEEHLWIAASMDRPGSIPEEIRLFRSSDQGSTWTASGAVDAAAVSQTHPSLAAYGATILLAYSYAALSNARDVRLVFSLDGGATFAPPQAVAASDADERWPHLVIDHEGATFSLFYLRGRAGSDSATVMLCTGSLATPWEIGAPLAVCDSNAAVASEEFSPATGAHGAAVVWTSRFVTGDCDVRFDAAWRGNPSAERAMLTPRQTALQAVYPNPFNSFATVVLLVDRPAPLTLTVADPLGRLVQRMECGTYATGEHHVRLNFGGLSSGMYFVRIENSAAPPRKALLIR